MKIEILGDGSVICKALFCNALEALRESCGKGRVVVVEDFRRMMRYGALSTPAVVIDGVVAFTGRLVSPEEIKAFLRFRHSYAFYAVL